MDGPDHSSRSQVSSLALLPLPDAQKHLVPVVVARCSSPLPSRPSLSLLPLCYFKRTLFNISMGDRLPWKGPL